MYLDGCIEDTWIPYIQPRSIIMTKLMLDFKQQGTATRISPRGIRDNDKSLTMRCKVCGEIYHYLSNNTGRCPKCNEEGK